MTISLATVVRDPDAFKNPSRSLVSGSAAVILADVCLWPFASHAHPDISALVASNAIEFGTIALLGLQTALIAQLMIQNHRRRRAQDEARQQLAEVAHAARLMLVGEMTASIAHEVSQPLSAILSNADAAEMLLSADPPPLDEVRQILDDIRRDDLRANEILRHLRTLLKKRELQLESIDVNDVATAVLSLARSDALRRGITVQAVLAPGLPKIAGDPVLLQQVLLNLIVNAMDAIADNPASERRLDVVTRMHDAESIEVAVVDTGTGVTTQQLPKLFDSFYTTKREGLGLGLSIARAIVQTHGGSIWAENSTAGGAVFKFTIPLAA